MKIVRVLNNNVVLATRDDDGEVVLTGWGLGFGKKAGQPVDKSKVKQVFVPEHGRNVDNMGSLLASLNLDSWTSPPIWSMVWRVPSFRIRNQRQSSPWQTTFRCRSQDRG
ncbi:CAT RNA binding domain-containing protein [Corynebacterium kroppenstedtii]|uniref:CAT RNA binding domain-containing protein n=1 Tax=Corynebacterium kroppenstedtii TaxID=161879 RepID=UPI0026CACC45|nr:CAT RNA binding domain-containing protein [Corynebacterium kroppenstedtii]MDU7286074.1 CAT RNA binding domain-containing protein [Corynebacterium kroppenstedtii]